MMRNILAALRIVQSKHAHETFKTHCHIAVGRLVPGIAGKRPLVEETPGRFVPSHLVEIHLGSENRTVDLRR